MTNRDRGRRYAAAGVRGWRGRGRQGDRDNVTMFAQLFKLYCCRTPSRENYPHSYNGTEGRRCSGILRDGGAVSGPAIRSNRPTGFRVGSNTSLECRSSLRCGTSSLQWLRPARDAQASVRSKKVVDVVSLIFVRPKVNR
ncbi:hypothetical protein EVAR_4550_1 [Eumeta japonica]|uniref:Uncharacterized protein n=1 Tax=Eumeta variegata TaxID=151549 RepID=A0A4C1SYQ1_EUMVA|nr:hypothetical protein EVAR_4550_1 [Eumeta japonica]